MFWSVLLVAGFGLSLLVWGCSVLAQEHKAVTDQVRALIDEAIEDMIAAQTATERSDLAARIKFAVALLNGPETRKEQGNG